MKTLGAVSRALIHSGEHTTQRSRVAFIVRLSAAAGLLDKSAKAVEHVRVERVIGPFDCQYQPLIGCCVHTFGLWWDVQAGAVV